MRKYLVIPVLFFILISRGSFAQEVTRNFLGGSFGGSDFHIGDEHASPLFFSSIGIAPTLQYIHKGDTDRHNLEFAYFYDYLSTSNENFYGDNYRGRIRYSYVHSIFDFKLFDEKTYVFLGGAIGSFMHHSDYYHEWVSQSLANTIDSWYWSNSLDISAQIEYNPSQREAFTFQIFIPLVSNVSRPAYSSSGDFNYEDNDWKFKMFGETEFFPANFALDITAMYARPLFWDLNLQFNYEFYYSFYDQPKEIQMYMNNLRAGLFYCF